MAYVCYAKFIAMIKAGCFANGENGGNGFCGTNGGSGGWALGTGSVANGGNGGFVIGPVSEGMDRMVV
jgi:hypothetical protein